MEESIGVQKRETPVLHEPAEIEVVRTRSRPFGFPLLQCGANHYNMDNQSVSVMLSQSEEEEDDDDDEDDDDRDEEEQQEDDNNDHGEDDEDDGSRHEQPNRDTSLMEQDEEEDDDDESFHRQHQQQPIATSTTTATSSSAQKKEAVAEEHIYHPALVAAEYAEGQEVMWNEDDVSTIVSVLVKPKETSEQKHKKKSRFGGLRQLVPAITIPEDKEIEDEPLQKIHVRKMKTKKTIVLLPQQGDEGAKTLVEANVKQEAALNMIKARQMLNQALLAEGENRLEDSEKLARSAFALASAARRMMATPEEEHDLEDILSVLAEKGEHAACEHQKIVLSQSFGSGSVKEVETTKPKGVLSTASKYANKAKHYLESILPKNVERELQESLSEEIMSSDTISTLGLKSDTSEYEMYPAPSNPTKSYTNMDLMSISSLNEILDGPDLEKSIEIDPPSPRRMLPVIDVPNRTPSPKSQAPAKKWISLSPRFHSSRSKKSEEVSQRGSFSFLGEQSIISKAPPSEQGKTEQTEPSDVAKMPIKQKKKWNLLKKLRRNKLGKKEAPDIIPEETKSLGDESDEVEEEEDEEMSNKSDEIGAIPSGPSKSFESSGRNSQISRYHIAKKNSSSSEEGQSASSSERHHDVWKSQSVESVRRLDTAKSDWDQSREFERRPVRKVPVKEIDAKIIKAPSRSEASCTPMESNENLKRSESDWDEPAARKKEIMQRKSIASLSLDGTSARETASRSESKSKEDIKAPISETPISQWTASVTRGRDFRSVQGNTGAETVAVTEADDSQANQTQSQQSKEAREEEEEEEAEEEVHFFPGENDSTAPVSEHPNPTKGRQSERSQSRQSDSKKTRESFAAYPTEELTQAGKDSLIDFVISPRRANVITPGGRRHFDADRGDEPSKIVIPVLHPIGEHDTEAGASASSDLEEDASELQGNKSGGRQPKIMRRISSLFTARNKSKNRQRQIHTDEESFDIERQDSGDKDLEKAISDGNMKAFEANLNAEKAPSNLFVQDNQDNSAQSETAHGTKSVQDTEVAEDSSTVLVLEKALSNAEKKAEEANLEVLTAPFPHRKSRRKHATGNRQSRPVPLDLVDAIRMQAGLERNTRKKDAKSSSGGDGGRRRESTGDAPGTSMQVVTTANSNNNGVAPRMDPPKDDGAGFRVLAPTPRKRPMPEGNNEDVNNASNEQDINNNKSLENVESEDMSEQRRITELLYGPSTSSDSFTIQEKITAKGADLKGVYIGDLIYPKAAEESSAASVSSESEEESYSPEEDEDTEDAENDENVENEKAEGTGDDDEKQTTTPPVDKENEGSALASPKADGGTPTPRGRLSLGGRKGPRKSMLSGIRNLISPSGQ